MVLSRGGGKGGQKPLAPQGLQSLQGLFFRLKSVDRSPVPGFDIRDLARGNPDGLVPEDSLFSEDLDGLLIDEGPEKDTVAPVGLLSQKEAIRDDGDPDLFVLRDSVHVPDLRVVLHDEVKKGRVDPVVLLLRNQGESRAPFHGDDSMLDGSSRILGGMPARCLMAWITTLEAACRRGELLPVMMVPSLSSMAAPQ